MDADSVVNHIMLLLIFIVLVIHTILPVTSNLINDGSFTGITGSILAIIPTIIAVIALAMVYKMAEGALFG